jgi:hypothetical protein
MRIRLRLRKRSSIDQRLERVFRQYRETLTLPSMDALKADLSAERLIAYSLKTVPRRYPNGKEFLFHCPWHEDAHPSLQVNPEKRRWFCHPCGMSGDAIDWVRRFYKLNWSQALRWIQGNTRRANRNWDDLEADDVEPIPRPAQKNGRVRSSRWRTVYRYCSALGDETYQIVRTRDKAFLFRHRGPHDTWIWNGDNVPRSLYHLDLLQGLPITFIVEGEKDADALWALKLPATTNPGGAGKWNDRYSRQLLEAGIRGVVIFPDNDRVGRAHARAVRASCREHGLRARIVKLPNLPPKGDVSDFIEAGHGRADLREYLNKWW